MPNVRLRCDNCIFLNKIRKIRFIDIVNGNYKFSLRVNVYNKRVFLKAIIFCIILFSDTEIGFLGKIIPAKGSNK